MTASQISIAKTLELLNIEGINASLDDMPDSPYQDYCRWILRHPDLVQEWLQLVGMTGLSRLTLSLLEGLLTPAELEMLLPYTVPINVFNMYEVMVDNVGIGLAYQTEEDTTFCHRQKIVRAANDAAIARLRGERRQGKNLIVEHPELAGISAFDQSLSPEKHRMLSEAYVQFHPESTLHSVEYSLYPILIANVEACNRVVATLQGYLTQGLVHKGFIRRFAGLNRLLDDTYISRDYLSQIGGNTIMVRPLLGYYIAVIAEEIRLIANYEAVVENGLLLRALEDAAMIVRLFNDVGPQLLEQDDSTHAALANHLCAAQQRSAFRSFRDLVLHVSEAANFGHALTRLYKDVKFGEFNISLYEPYRCGSVTESIEAFHQQLVYLSCIYRDRLKRLDQSLAIISFETQSTLIADIIWRFIRFHDQMYRAPSDKWEGEYAV